MSRDIEKGQNKISGLEPSGQKLFEYNPTLEIGKIPEAQIVYHGYTSKGKPDPWIGTYAYTAEEAKKGAHKAKKLIWSVNTQVNLDNPTEREEAANLVARLQMEGIPSAVGQAVDLFQSRLNNNNGIKKIDEPNAYGIYVDPARRSGLNVYYAFSKSGLPSASQLREQDPERYDKILNRAREVLPRPGTNKIQAK